MKRIVIVMSGLAFIMLLTAIISSSFRIDRLEKRVDTMDREIELLDRKTIGHETRLNNLPGTRYVATKTEPFSSGILARSGKGYITIHEDHLAPSQPEPIYGKMSCKTGRASDGHIDWYQCTQSVTREETKP